MQINSKLLATHENYISNTNLFFKEKETTVKSIINSERDIVYILPKKLWPVWVREGILHAWNNKLQDDIFYDLLIEDLNQINSRQSTTNRFTILGIAEINKDLSIISHRKVINKPTQKENFYLGYFYRFWYIYDSDKITDFYPNNAIDSATIEPKLPSYLPNKKLMKAVYKCVECGEYHKDANSFDITNRKRFSNSGQQFNFCLRSQALKTERRLRNEQNSYDNNKLIKCSLNITFFKEHIFWKINQFYKILHFNDTINEIKKYKRLAKFRILDNNRFHNMYLSQQLLKDIDTLIYKKHFTEDYIIELYKEGLENEKLRTILNEYRLQNL